MSSFLPSIEGGGDAFVRFMFFFATLGFYNFFVIFFLFSSGIRSYLFVVGIELQGDTVTGKRTKKTTLLLNKDF